MLLGLFLLLILITIVLFLKFSLELNFEINGSKVDYIVRLKLGRYFLAVPTRLTARMEKMIRKSPVKGFDDVLQNLQDGWRSIDYFFQEIQYLKLEIFYGLGDPLWTALGYGSIWAFLGTIINTLGGSGRLNSVPEISLQPDYNHLGLQVKLYCIFQFRLGHIISRELKRLGDAWFA